MDVNVEQENCEAQGAASPKKPSVEGREEFHFPSIIDDLSGKKCTEVENLHKELAEEKTPESHDNSLERLEISEALNKNSNHVTQIPNDSKLDSGVVVTELAEQKQVVGAENFGNKLESTKDPTTGFEEMGPAPGEDASNVGIEQKVVPLNNMATTSVMENSEESPEVKPVTVVVALGCFSATPGSKSLTPLSGQRGRKKKDVTNDPSHSKAEYEQTPIQLREKRSTSKSSVNSTWDLLYHSQEKPKASDSKDIAVEDTANGEKRRGRKKEINKNPVNEFSKTRTHLRYLLHRIRYEQSLIDAYSAEGWKGQSLEKLKPEKELQRAKSHILSYKLRIRELFQRLDQSLAVGKLPALLFDSKGEIDSEDIFCSKCGSKDLTSDNDIILCDGACERGFHQFCVEPPLLKEDIPPDDEGWLCPGCDCKVDCIGYLNDFQGTNLSVLESWEKMFPEAAAAASGKKLDDLSLSSSDDSEDDDYEPDKPETVEEKISGDESSFDESGDESSSDDSDYFSASDDLAASPNIKQHLGLPSDDSEDDDFDPAARDQDEEEKQKSSSSDFTSDSEDLNALLNDAATTGISHEDSADEGKSEAGNLALGQESSFLLESKDPSVSRKRHVERLDYKKLNDEAYGNSSSESSDEDFEDVSTRKRRRIKSETAADYSHETPLAKCEMDSKDENQKESKQGSKRSAYKRLGEAATQRLLESFRKNQYPERAEKEKLAEELGLTFQQVTKWFDNTRWSFNHRSQMELKKTETGLKEGSSLNQDKDKI